MPSTGVAEPTSASRKAPSAIPAVDGLAAGPPVPQRWDVRLVPAATLGWVTAWVAPKLAFGILLALALAALTAGSLLLIRRASFRRRSGWSAAAALALAGLGLVAGTSAAHIHARDGSPLRQLAAEGQDVRLRVEVSDQVRILAPGSSSSRVLVPATVLAVSCDRPCGDSAVRSWSLSADVLVFASLQGWAQLTPGATVSAPVTLARAALEDLLVGIAFARGPPEAFAHPGVLDRAAAGIRGGLRDRADQTLGRDEAGLLRGIVIGDTTGMDAVLAEDFRISGLSHLTAVSGTNCAIVIGAVLWPLRRSRLRGLTRALIAALALAGFVVLVGPQPSVLRAAVMGAITLLALGTGRARQAIPALAGAVLLLCALDPGLARDLGFALSVAATAGIIVVAGSWGEKLGNHGWPAFLATATAVCAAAGLFTAPVLLLIVDRVSLISLPANLLVVPVVAAVTVLGLAAALVAPVWPWLAEVLLRACDLPLRWMVWVAERSARTPGAVLPWPGGVGGAVALVAVIVASIILLRRRRIRWLAAAACVGVVVSGVSVRSFAPTWPPTGWSLVACDVGQGDALVVSLGPGRAVVVDAGPDPLLVDGCLRRLGVQEVPLLLLSHLHADHVDGMVGVFRGRSVGAVATSADAPPVQVYARIHRLTKDAEAAVLTFRPGETRVVQAATIEVLGPVTRYVGTRSDPNNSSLVARITVGDVSILTTGDIEFEAQSDLLRRGTDLSADVLKVAHHGSAYQEPAFLTATQSRVALISVGVDNDYGHPDETLLDRLAAAGMSVHRTDQDGDIAVTDASGSELAVFPRGDPIQAQAAPFSGPTGSDLPPRRQRHARATLESGRRWRTPDLRWRRDRGVRPAITRGPTHRPFVVQRRVRSRGRGRGRRQVPRRRPPRLAGKPVRPRD